jgi:pyridoxal phosphate enzyme (YggS family)
VVLAASDVAARLSEVRARIERASPAHPVSIVAVTKAFGPDAWLAAAAAGLRDVGENYAQELVAKATDPSVSPALRDLRVHFIGRLQTNKVRVVAPLVALWQSVERESVAREIAKRAPGASVLVQVDVTGEPTKGGCVPGDAGQLVERCTRLGLAVEGLMAVGRTGPPEGARPGFSLLRSLCDALGLGTCSMGMTDDLDVAVEEGSTMVRIGSALFGQRPTGPGRAK